jgi:hypothetical protein
MNNTTPYFPENITDYAPWVTRYGLRFPYGECQCGCSKKTRIAPYNWAEYGWTKGQPKQFVNGHVTRRPVAERFWEKVDKRGPDDCWLWTGSKKNGYGSLRVGRTNIPAHRFSWELHNATIPSGMRVLHNCPEGDNPSCVNPAHLFLGTQADNIADMEAKGRAVHVSGESSGMTKLTEVQVRAIRERAAQGERQVNLAREFEIDPSHIFNIVNRKSWKHIE